MVNLGWLFPWTKGNESTRYSKHREQNIDLPDFTGLKTLFPTCDQAIECAKLAKLAFDVDKLDSPAFKEAGTSELTVSSVDKNSVDTDVFVAFSDSLKYVVVSFRGSESDQDWENNRKALFTNKLGPRALDNENNFDWEPDEGSKVHSGFNKAFFTDGLHQQVEYGVRSVLLDHPDYELLVTGHSLGGAMATFGGLYLAKQMPERFVKVLAYGAPRVGNEAFKNWVNGIPNLGVWRFVYEEDLITRIPPMILGYFHIGHLIQLQEKKGTQAHYLQWGDEELGYIGPPKSKWNQIPDSGFRSAREDHGIKHYITYLEQKSKVKPEKYWAEKFEKSIADASQEAKSRGGDETSSWWDPILGCCK